MKKLQLALFFLLVVLTASSQKVYFAYIQTEAEQPFYVKLNDKISSSTASGYIIIPKLLDSSYSFSIGFPQNKWPEQNFIITINKRDHGFLLKNFGEKGWGLFDLQTLSIQMSISGKASISKKPEIEIGTVSEFTEMLSRAANDPSLLEKPKMSEVENKKTEISFQELKSKEAPKVDLEIPVSTNSLEVVQMPVVKNEDPKTEIKETDFGNSIQSSDQSIAKKEDSIAEEKKKDITKPVVSLEKSVEKVEETVTEVQKKPISPTKEAEGLVVETFKSTQIKKWSESSTTEGFGLVFIDENENGQKDTIRLLIPNQKPIFDIAKEDSPDKKKALVINADGPQKENIEITTNVNSQTTEKNTVLKNICIETASEKDFYLLRKNMAAVLSDEEMIAEAKIYFKIKCFTSAQLKNLSTLFLNDEGKYKFFNASYKYVYDVESFNTLLSEFKDEYFAGQFKAMIRN